MVTPFAAQSNYAFINKLYSSSIQNNYGDRELASNWIVGLHTHSRGPNLNGNGTGSAIVRVFSNTVAVENYIKSKEPGEWSIPPRATVDSITTEFGLSASEPDGGISITNTGPQDSRPVSATKFSFLSKIPYIGDPIVLFGQAYAAIENANPAVSSKVIYRGHGGSRITKTQKNFANINSKATDFSSSPSSKPLPELQKGGVTSMFDYTEYLTGRGTLYSKGQVFYHVESSGLYYNGVYASFPFVNSFTINF